MKIEKTEVTVKRSELSTLKMVAGNEKKFGRVIDGDVVKNWVGFGWVDEGKATKNDFANFPLVED